MNRDRNYYRKMRAKHIIRKKRIIDGLYHGSWYKHDGMFSKGKIHCSCPLYRGKDIRGRHIKTRQELRSDDSIKDQIEWYEWLQIGLPIDFLKKFLL